jgi:hypothetical protein
MNPKEPAMNAPHVPVEARFKWDDPLLLDSQLSEEERLVRDAWCGPITTRGASAASSWKRA